MFDPRSFSKTSFSATSYLFAEYEPPVIRPPDVVTRKARPRIMVVMGRLMGRCIILVPTLSVLFGA